MKRILQDSDANTPDKDRHSSGTYQPTAIDRFGTFSMILLLAVSLVLFARLILSQFLATKYLLILMLALLVVNAIQIFVQVPLRKNKLGKLISGTLSVLLSVAMIWGMVGFESFWSVLGKITSRMVQTDVIAVAVRTDDDATELLDTVGYTYGYSDRLDHENNDDMLAHLQAEIGTFPTHISENMTDLLQDLYDKEADAIFFNKGYLSLLEDSKALEEFNYRTRIIYEHTITREVEIERGSISVTDPFIVYCSGIDARSNDLGEKSRSDVNILAVVNPVSHQILLLNTPRDYYLPLHMNGEMDKLTHAGLYGIEESMNTLDDLYGTKSSYFVRVNFNGLVDIVDALGGIDVVSPMAFETNTMEIPSEDGTYFEQRSFYFPEGPVHLSGREALAFSRERYAFADGDNQRGRNQMTVIQGIVSKALSPAILSSYRSLLKAVSNSMVTNVSGADMAQLAQLQQRENPKWNIVSYAVTGYDGSEYTYSYGEAYVMWPDEYSVDTAKELIRQVLAGETISVPEEE